MDNFYLGGNYVLYSSTYLPHLTIFIPLCRYKFLSGRIFFLPKEFSLISLVVLVYQNELSKLLLV